MVDWIKAVDKLKQGKVDEFWELMVPIKFIADTMKGTRKLEAGETDEYGRALQMIGFRTQKEAKKTTERGIKFSDFDKAKEERNNWYTKYNTAKTAGERAKIKSQIREWNRKKRPQGVKDINVGGLEKYRREHYTGSEEKRYEFLEMED